MGNSRADRQGLIATNFSARSVLLSPTMARRVSIFLLPPSFLLVLVLPPPRLFFFRTYVVVSPSFLSSLLSFVLFLPFLILLNYLSDKITHSQDHVLK